MEGAGCLLDVLLCLPLEVCSLSFFLDLVLERKDVLLLGGQLRLVLFDKLLGLPGRLLMEVADVVLKGLGGALLHHCAALLTHSEVFMGECSPSDSAILPVLCLLLCYRFQFLFLSESIVEIVHALHLFGLILL